MGKKENEDWDEGLVEIRTGGRLTTEDGPAVCWKCKGRKGWHMKNNILKHVPCGTIQ